MSIKTILSSILPDTVLFFGNIDKVKEFLELIRNTSSVASACNEMGFDPLELQAVIDFDKSLASAIELSKKYAAGIAEGALYTLAVHNYKKEVHNASSKKERNKSEYSSRALLDYLKYKTKSNIKVVSNSQPNLKVELVDFKN